MSSNFNSRPLILFAGGAIYIVLTLMLFRALLGGDIMRSAALMGLAVALLFNAYRKYWIGILLGSLTLYGGAMEIPFLMGVPPYVAIMAIIAGYFVLDYAMKKRAPLLRWRGIYTLFLFVAFALTVRVVYDRPGGAVFGAGTGGVRKAFEYLFSVYAFFIAYWATAQAGSWKTNQRIILVISFASFALVHVIFRYLTGSFAESVYGLSFNWALYPIYGGVIVGSLSPTSRRLFSDIAFFVVTVFVLAMGAISQTRAAIVQVPLMVLMAAFIYRRIPTAVITIALAGTVGLGALLSTVPYYKLPDNVRRPISVLMGSKETEASYGTKDEWREGLQRFAWKKIEKSPLVGNGWNFDVGELISAMSFGAQASASQYSSSGGQLDMTGSFHNVFLTIAANNGVPTAAAQVAAIAFSMLLLAFYARGLNDCSLKSALAFLLVFDASVFTMYFVNGGAWDSFALSATLGTAFALRDVAERQDSDPQHSPSQNASTAPSVAPAAVSAQNANSPLG